MPASLLASMMPWRQVLRSCADAPPARPASIANIADNRTTFERLSFAICALLWLAPPALARPFNGPTRAGTRSDRGRPAAPTLPSPACGGGEGGGSARPRRRRCRFSFRDDGTTLYTVPSGRKHQCPEHNPLRPLHG